MRRWRMVTAGLTGIVLGAGLALGGATSASAAPASHWGTFTLSGSSRAYTGTMTLPGFPETTFTSNSRQSTVISGASTWQGPGTPPGAEYGTSRGSTYMNQRPNVDSPNAQGASTTTYTFATPTPGNGSWSFVLGDIDADQASISATVQGGAAATSAQLGYQSSYNSCSTVSTGGWSCPADPGGVPAGQDTPTWTDTPTGGTLVGNAAANDTSGASAWFTPTVPLDSLTITYQQRSGFPVYQTWFANKTAALSGTVTLDGSPIPGATVTVTAPRGTVYTTTADADGTYLFPDLPQIGGYVVSVATPAGAQPVVADPATVSLVGADGVADRAFVSPPDTVSVIGTVTDDQGRPAADVPVTITDPTSGTVLTDTVTNGDGVYTGSALPPATDLEVAVDGCRPTTITTGAVDGPPAQVPPVVAPVALATISGVVSLDGTGVPAGVVVDLLDASGALVGSTTTDAAGRYAFAVDPGVYRVRTTEPAAGATGDVVRPADASAGDVTVDLPFTTPVAPSPVVVDQPGTVTAADGTPAAGVVVVATPTGPDAGDAVQATTATDGSFTLTGLQPTTPYSVVAGTGDQASGPQTVTTVGTGETPVPLAFVLPAAPTVDQPGAVTDASGVPAADVPVVATPTGGGDPVSTTTAADGTFDLTGLTPSTEYAVVAGSGAQTSDPQVVTTAAVGATPVPLAFVLPAAVVTPAPTPTTPVPTVPTSAGGSGASGPLAFTGAEIAPAAIAAGVLVLLGGGLLTFRAARNRRRTGHLQD